MTIAQCTMMCKVSCVSSRNMHADKSTRIAVLRDGFFLDYTQLIRTTLSLSKRRKLFSFCAPLFPPKKSKPLLLLVTIGLFAHTAPKLWIKSSSKPPKAVDLKTLTNGITVGVAVRCNWKGGKMQAALLSPASKSNKSDIRQSRQ